MRTEIPKLVKEAPSVMPKGPSLVTAIVTHCVVPVVSCLDSFAHISVVHLILYFKRQREPAVARRQTAGIKFTQAKNQVFSPRRGDSLHRFMSNVAWWTGTWVRLVTQSFTSIGAGGWECGPKIWKKIHFLVKSRHAGANPLTDF